MKSKVSERKPVMKSVTMELPGGFMLQRTEPDGDNTYTEEQIDEAIREITEPYIKEAFDQQKQEMVEMVRGMKKHFGLTKNQVIPPVLTANCPYCGRAVNVFYDEDRYIWKNICRNQHRVAISRKDVELPMYKPQYERQREIEFDKKEAYNQALDDIIKRLGEK